MTGIGMILSAIADAVYSLWSVKFNMDVASAKVVLGNGYMHRFMNGSLVMINTVKAYGLILPAASIHIAGKPSLPK